MIKYEIGLLKCVFVTDVSLYAAVSSDFQCIKHFCSALPFLPSSLAPVFGQSSFIIHGRWTTAAAQPFSFLFADEQNRRRRRRRRTAPR